MKRDLVALKRRADKSEAACSTKRLCRSASNSRVYNLVIFCDKVKKYIKGSNTREKLT